MNAKRTKYALILALSSAWLAIPSAQAAMQGCPTGMMPFQLMQPACPSAQTTSPDAKVGTGAVNEMVAQTDKPEAIPPALSTPLASESSSSCPSQANSGNGQGACATNNEAMAKAIGSAAASGINIAASVMRALVGEAGKYFSETPQ